MNSQKFKTDSYCVGGKHRSGTKNITGEITINKKTGRENNLLVGKCVICNRKKSMIVSDDTIQAEGLGDFFKNLGKKGLNVSKEMAKNVLKKTPVELSKLVQTLVLHLLLETRKQLWHHCQKWLISIIPGKAYTYPDFPNLCYINGPKMW